MSFFHGKTVGIIRKKLVRRIYCQRELHIDAFKENHKFCCGLRIFQNIKNVRRNIISNISYKN